MFYKMLKNIFLLGCIVAASAKRTIVIPENFKIGTATASYQIEGGWDAHGKGPSIWDTFTHENPHLVVDEANGDVAANSYELYEEDVKALKSIGAEFYRFSISWPRVLTNGDISSRNEAGIQYYHKLINSLVENGIEPIVTMYHWDLPQNIQDLGGFTSPYFVKYFEQYANLLYKEYGAKVKTWITFNEPINYCSLGYGLGNWPPVLKLAGVGEYLCAHYTILAHAKAYRLYKEKYFEEQKGEVGISLYSNFAFPEDDTNAEHIAAADRVLQFTLGLYAHPIFSADGDYPQVIRDRVEENSLSQGYIRSRLPKFTADEIDDIKGSADFLGINYYTSYYVTQAANDDDLEQPSKSHDEYVHMYQDSTWPPSHSVGVVSCPDGLYNLLKWIRDEYNNVEVIITENGWSDEGQIDDVGRVTYLEEHFEATIKAVEEGCNVTGHTTWSLIDNFEWLKGYSEKYGIIRVDVEDPKLERVEKRSAGWLRDVIENRKFDIEED